LASIVDDEQFLIFPKATYPRTYNPLFAMACCILAVAFASMFAIIFPLMGPPVVLLVFLTLVGTMHNFSFLFKSDRKL
jgi:calcium permeable stress-gated cation channel